MPRQSGPALLSRTLYVSDAVGSAGSTVLSMAEILGASIRNNRRDHLTGALLYHRGRFLCAVEGARADLDRLKRRLIEDRRHENLRTLADALVAERLFPGQPMAQCRVDAAVERLIGPAGVDALTAREAEQVLIQAAVPLDIAV